LNVNIYLVALLVVLTINIYANTYIYTNNSNTNNTITSDELTFDLKLIL